MPYPKDGSPPAEQSSTHAETLRQRAETMLAQQAEAPAAPNPVSASAETQQLIHDLKVHQVELALQNEELQRTQTALEAERGRYFKLYELAPMGYCTLNEQGRIIEANPALAELLDRPRSKLIEQPFARFLARADQDVFYLQCLRCRTNGDKHTREMHLIRADQSSLWALLKCFHNVNQDGELLTYLAIIDISSQKQALHASEERFELAMNATRDGLFDWDLVTDAIYYSPGWKHMLGYAEDELPNTVAVWAELADPEALPWWWKQQQELIHGQRERLEMEFRMRHKEGHWVDVLSRASVLFNEQGQAVRMIGTHVDITERKRQELELQHMQKLESLGTVAGGIAHDFNNLLAGLFLNLELVGDALPANSAAQQPLQMALDAIYRSKHLTKQLLTFAKGGTPLLTAVDTASLVHETLQFNLHGSAIETRCHLPADLWPLQADRELIAQVIANLTINARQAMPAGGTLYVEGENLAGRQAAGLDSSRDYVRLAFCDEGPGIPAKHLERLFDPYFTTKDTGSGLGLAVVHGIVNQHQGRINVHSTPGSGTTFTLDLPATHEAPAATPAHTADADLPQTWHVLVMDDEAMIQAVVEQNLTRFGHHVTLAADGHAAIAQYKTAQASGQPFDVVIMDLTVPGGLGGLQATQALFEFDPHARIIVASGYCDDPVMAHYRDYGFAGRLVKPFKLETLRDEIAQVMAET